MVLVKAEEMALTIGATGKIALYGIYFDFASEPAIRMLSSSIRARQSSRGWLSGSLPMLIRSA